MITLTQRERFRSTKTAGFKESVICDMSRLALQHGAVNLAQGFPDFPAPELVKNAAVRAIEHDINQYANTWGAKSLRNAIAEKYRKTYALEYDPEREITVCCGATEGMIASLMGVTNPGDEIVLFEPFYENYRPDALALRRHQQTRNSAPAALDIRSRRTTKRLLLANQSDYPEHPQ